MTALVVFVVAGISAWAGDPVFQSDVRPVLEQHCFKCHGEKKQKGKVRLDTLSTDLVKDRRSAESWHMVRSVLNLGEMPPDGEPSLSDKERRLLLGWLNKTIDHAAKTRRDKGGRVVVRRLNRVEYQHTLRDLLGLDLDFVADLPPDGISPDGMLNNGSSLQMTGLQFEYYLKAARDALDHAIVTSPEPKVFEHRFEKSTEGRWVDKITPDNSLGDRREFLVRIRNDYPESGAFRVLVRARAEFPDAPGPLPRMAVYVGYRPDTLVDRRLLGEVDIKEAGSHAYEFVGRMENFPLPVRGQGKFPGLVISVGKVPVQGDPPLIVESLEFKGPVFESWPPEHHQRILHPTVVGRSREVEYAREVVERFVTRAWRRPLTSQEVDRFLDFFSKLRPETPSFEEAIKETLTMALVSPSFLYLLEPESVEPRPLRPYELASRLSYFLWSTLPDAALMEAADSAALLTSGELSRQVKRMLADERSGRFVRQFTTLWLDLNAAERIEVDRKAHSGIDERLLSDMRKETTALFGELLRQDLSARHLVTSDFTMLNNRLARYYGIDGVNSGEFERVALEGEHLLRRGGLLTQASVLLGGSDGRDSNPVKRAVFLRKRLLNDPPAPPPPNVPELETADPEFARLSIREQLAVHLKDPACAECHRGIDPWGQAMEEYDAVGRWREKIIRRISGKKEMEFPVDAEARLPDGNEISGMAELKAYLWEHRREQFARALVSKLLTYALGRSLDFADDAEISALTKEFLKNDLRVGQLVQSIVASPLFRYK